MTNLHLHAGAIFERHYVVSKDQYCYPRVSSKFVVLGPHKVRRQQLNSRLGSARQRHIRQQ